MPIAVYALTAGAFGIGTTEFVIMGLLLQVAADLGVSVSAAGNTTSPPSARMHTWLSRLCTSIPTYSIAHYPHSDGHVRAAAMESSVGLLAPGRPAASSPLCVSGRRDSSSACGQRSSGASRASEPITLGAEVPRRHAARRARTSAIYRKIVFDGLPYLLSGVRNRLRHLTLSVPDDNLGNARAPSETHVLAMLAAMFVFSLSMSISPGPVNMVIVSSGANHGFRRTMPFVSGATIGFTLLLVFVGFSLLGALHDHPRALAVLELAGAAFIVYVGYKIASSPPEVAMEKRSVPTFAQGVLLQWLNPKAWIACASGATLFFSPETHATLLMFIAVYFLICYASLAAWAVLGARVSVLLNSHLRLRLFNLLMGAMLIASAGYVLFLHFLRQPG